MAFNFFTAGEIVTQDSVLWFGGRLMLAIALSVLVCFGLIWLLVRNRGSIKFFLVFAVLIIVYAGGKMLHLPSLITIMIFGLVVNNWEMIRWKPLHRFFPVAAVDGHCGFPEKHYRRVLSHPYILLRDFWVPD